jgi:hypothetical protein
MRVRGLDAITVDAATWDATPEVRRFPYVETMRKGSVVYAVALTQDQVKEVVRILEQTDEE